MKALIADDQYEVRSALRILLEHEPEFRVIGEALGMQDLISKVEQDIPDLVLLDWELDYKRMTEIIPKIRAINPTMKIIALSCNPEAACAALSSGVDAFVSKGDHPEILLDAIREITKNRLGSRIAIN